MKCWSLGYLKISTICAIVSLISSSSYSCVLCIVRMVYPNPTIVTWCCVRRMSTWSRPYNVLYAVCCMHMDWTQTTISIRFDCVEFCVGNSMSHFMFIQYLPNIFVYKFYALTDDDEDDGETGQLQAYTHTHRERLLLLLFPLHYVTYYYYYWHAWNIGFVLNVGSATRLQHLLLHLIFRHLSQYSHSSKCPSTCVSVLALAFVHWTRRREREREPSTAVGGVSVTSIRYFFGYAWPCRE